jgi:perosamine synthetase
MNVPILRIPFDESAKETISKGVLEVLDSGHLTMGRFTREFEERFAELVGVRYAVATNSCTSALEIILRSLGISGKNVIVPTNTFLATALAVMESGNRVVLADSNTATLCLDADDLERRTDAETAAVMLVHVGGIVTPEIGRIRDFCQSRGLYLIEDCAHAHGCAVDGMNAGSLGVAGAFSFFPTKVLVTGEGGMITTDDEGVYTEALKIRNHGKDPALGGRMSTMGYNHRMHELTAVLGLQQVANAPEIFKERGRIAAAYDRQLDGITGLVPFRLPEGTRSTYYKYVVWLDEGVDRPEFKRKLKEQYGVSLTGEVYAEPCHTEPLWQSFSYCGAPLKNDRVPCTRWPSCGCDKDLGGFPGAEHACNRHVCLPLYPGLTDAEIDHVVSSIQAALETVSAG